MESMDNDLPVIERKVYRKDKPMIYMMGVFFLGGVGLMGYLLYEDTSATFSIGLMLLIGLFLLSIWYPGFRIRNNVIEITPQFLRIDDCEFKEIPWSDICHMEIVDHFSTRLGRFVHLIIYFKNEDKYSSSRRGRFFSRQRVDGGMFATDLYNYSEDHKKIFKDLSKTLEDSQFLFPADVSIPEPSPLEVQEEKLQSQNLETILSSTDRLSFSVKEALVLTDYVAENVGGRYCLSIDPMISNNVEDLEKALLEGFIILRSDILDVCVLFVKVNCGKGFFGGQKSKIMSFTGRPSDSSYTPGRVFRNLSASLRPLVQK